MQLALLIVALAAVVALAQAYEYIFPLGHGWVYDYGAGFETIPVHFALVNQHAMGAPLVPFVAGGVDRLSFFGSADSPLILSKAYVDGREVPPFRVNHTQIGLHLPNSGTFHVRLAYDPPYRQLNDILAAPSWLLPDASRSEPFSRQLELGDLPTVCLSTNAEQ